MFGRFVTRLAAPLVLGAPLVAQHLAFGAPQAADVADTSSGIHLAVGDVTGDGRPDVIAARSKSSGMIELLANDGSGKLLDGLPLANGSADALSLIDANDDGNLDLFSADGTIAVRFGLGGGAFGPPQELFDHNDATFRLLLADVTGDDLIDLVAVSGKNFANARVDVLPGLGDGTFGPATFGEGLFTLLPLSVDAGDLNEDGNADLVVAGIEGDGSAIVRIYLGAGGGTFAAPTTIGGATRAWIAPLNEDAHLDLVLEGGFGVLGRVLGAGDGTFAPASLFGQSILATNLAFADFDLDGHLDLAGLDSQVEELFTWRGASNGLPSASTRVTLFKDAGGDLAAADFDGDGRQDLVLSGPATSDTVVVLLNHSYRPGDPWTDLGYSKPENQIATSNPLGLNHRPILWAEGSLESDAPFTLHIVRNGVWVVKAFLVVGFAELYGPLKGGTLVPSADLLIGPVFANQNGEFPLAGALPAGVPPGFTFTAQAWFYPSQPPGATQYAATSAVRATTP